MAPEPGPGVRPKKKWRGRRIAGIWAKPRERAGVFLDASGFVLGPHRTTCRAEPKRPRRVPKNKSGKRGERPPSGALSAETDVAGRAGSGEGHPTGNQDETWAFLEGGIGAYPARGARSLSVFGDHGPGHVAASVRRKVAAPNRPARRDGGIRVRLFFLPIRSPWLMPREGVLGPTKRAIGGVADDALPDLQGAVERRLVRRNAKVTRPTDQPKASTHA